MGTICAPTEHVSESVKADFLGGTKAFAYVRSWEAMSTDSFFKYMTSQNL